MSGAFNTQTDQMVKTASQVDDTNTQVTSALASLQNSVEAVQAHWQGAAAASFQGLMVRWHEDAQKLQQALTDISEQIRTSGQTYSQADTAGTTTFNSAGGGLNV